MLADRFGKKLQRKETTGYAPGRMRCAGGDGILTEVSRSFVSAAYWVARHTHIEMLEPLNYLSCLLGPDWSLQADAGLTHVYGYWFACLEDNCARWTSVFIRRT